MGNDDLMAQTIKFVRSIRRKAKAKEEWEYVPNAGTRAAIEKCVRTRITRHYKFQRLRKKSLNQMEQKFALFVWAPIQNSLTNKGSVNVCECDTGELDAGEDSRAEEKGRGWGLPDEGDGNGDGYAGEYRSSL